MVATFLVIEGLGVEALGQLHGGWSVFIPIPEISQTAWTWA